MRANMFPGIKAYGPEEDAADVKATLGRQIGADD